jgi:hypothetical protein
MTTTCSPAMCRRAHVCHQLPSLISLCLFSPNSPSLNLSPVTQQLLQLQDDSESTGGVLMRKLRATFSIPWDGGSPTRVGRGKHRWRQGANTATEAGGGATAAGGAGDGVQAGGGAIFLPPPLRPCLSLLSLRST